MTWAGPLEEYLAHPPPVDNAPWRFGEEPWNAIPKWSKQFNEGKTDRDKAIAIGNLVMTAERMATFPKAREATIQLMDQMVMPNIEVTKRVDITLFCAWRGIMVHCASVYKNLGKFESQRDCLERYVLESDIPRDKNYGFFRLAQCLADQENYSEALQVIARYQCDGDPPNSKDFYTSLWEKKMKEKDAEKAQHEESPTAPDGGDP